MGPLILMRGGEEIAEEVAVLQLASDGSGRRVRQTYLEGGAAVRSGISSGRLQLRGSMHVRDIMTVKVFTIGADKKLFVANEIME